MEKLDITDGFADREDIIEAEDEEEDMVQDWTEISRMVLSNNPISLPRRGDKEYEPDGSNIQEVQLSKAKDIMFDTLRNSIRGSVIKSKVKAYYNIDKHKAYVPHPKGSFLQTMGWADSNGVFWLDFHELVYLSERGTVTPYWGSDDSNDDDGNLDIPLSIEDLYLLFKSQEDYDNFLVYSQLKRLGFIVLLEKDNRYHATSFFPPVSEHTSMMTAIGSNIRSSISSVFVLNKALFSGTFLYSKWNYILRRFTTNDQLYNSIGSLIPTQTVPKSDTELREYNGILNGNPPSNLKIVFKLWKPQVNFKKKSPALPDYQIVVYNKNNKNQQFPSYLSLKNIFSKLDYKFDFLQEIDDDFWDKNTFTNGVPRLEYLTSIGRNLDKKNSKGKKSGQVSSTPFNNKKKKPKGRSKLSAIKQGYRSFLLAVVDNGLVSFIRISETEFRY